jgi:hypothetical protein
MIRKLFCAGLAACAGLACADTVLEYDGADAACHADFARLAISGLSLRIDSAPPEQDHSFVYDSAEKTGVALDHRRRQMFELEFDDDAIDFQSDVMKSASNMVDRKVEKIQAQTCGRDGGACPATMPGSKAMGGMPQIDPKQIESLMQQNMAHMTPEQRAQMERSIKALRESGYGGMAGPAATPITQATGERRDVNGIGCAVERVTLGGEVLREDCRADVADLGLDAADLKRLQRALLRMQKFSAAIRDNLRIAASAMKRDPDDGRRVLVARRCFDNGRRSGEVNLRVRGGATPAEWFTIPADYSRLQMNGGNAEER